MLPDTSFWSWLGWAVLAIGLVLSLYGCVADRARGRKRCAGCRYDMNATEANEAGQRVCPECGRKSKNDKELSRPRARRRLVLLGVLIALSGHVFFSVPRIMRSGWIGAVPTTFLAPLTPWYGADFSGAWRQALTVELKTRDAAGEVHGVAAYLWGWRSGISLAADRGGDEELVYSMYDTRRAAHACGMSGSVTENNAAVQQGVISFIDPENWADNGGATSQIYGVGRVLATHTTRANDSAVRVFIEALAAQGDVIQVGRSVTDETPIRSRLRETEVRLPDGRMQLDELTALIAAATGLTLRIDADAIEDQPVYLATPLEFPKHLLRSDEALDLAVGQLWGGSERRVSWFIADGVVRISPIEVESRLTTRIVIYDLRDLVDRPDPDWIIEESSVVDRATRVLNAAAHHITQTVDSESWAENGGEHGFIMVLGRRLVVMTTARHHAAIRELLKKARAN
ncbi:MAG: hypothetical protein JNK25_05390 [Phycisphaerae bacterium]|nr:hypothetical protein [Phycisphaerae bacterium]